MAFLVKEEQEINSEDEGELESAVDFEGDVAASEAQGPGTSQRDPFAAGNGVNSAMSNIMSHWADAQEAEPGLKPDKASYTDDRIAEHSHTVPTFESGIAGDFVPDSALGPTFGGGGGGGGGGGKGGTPPGDPFPPDDPNNPDNPNNPNK